MSSWAGTSPGFPPKIRKRILARAHHRCEIGGPKCTGRATEADHRVPHAEWPRGKPGVDDESNGQAACHECHEQKTRREQARGRARRNPRRKLARHPSEVNVRARHR